MNKNEIDYLVDKEVELYRKVRRKVYNLNCIKLATSIDLISTTIYKQVSQKMLLKEQEYEDDKIAGKN